MPSFVLQFQALRILWIFIAAAAISSCGGGGDPSVPDDLGDIGVDSYELSLVVSSSNDGQTLAQGSEASDVNTVSVSLTSPSGGSVASRQVQLTTTIGTIAGNAQRLTNSSGVASFEISLTGATEGDSGVITASFTDDNTSTTITQTLNVQAGAEDNTTPVADANLTIALTSAANDNRTLNQGSEADDINTISVTLSSTSGSINGQTIQLSTTLGTVSGNSQRLTDANGVATFQIRLTGATPGDAGTITANFTDPNSTTTATQTLNVQAGNEDDGSAVSDASLSLSLTSTANDGRTLSQGSDTDDINTINVTLSSSSSNVNGQTIQLSSTLGTISGNAQRLTDQNGNASFELVLNGATEGDSGVITASFTDPDSATPATATLNVQAGPVDNNVPTPDATLSFTINNVNDNRVLNQGTDTNEINTIAISLSSDVVAIANQNIQLSSTLGTITGNGQSLTDNNGLVSFTLTLTGANPGDAGLLTATFTDPATSQTFTDTFNVIAGAADDGQTSSDISLAILVSTSPDGITLEQSVENTITVTASDGLVGTDFENQIISLTSDLGVISGNGQALTDANGVATFRINLDSAAEGDAGLLTANITHSETQITATNTLNVVAGASLAEAQLTLSIVAAAGDPANTLNQDAGNDLDITLTDANGPRSGQVVLLGTTIGVISPTQILTNAAGEATARITSTGLAASTAGTITARYIDPTSNEEETQSVNAQVGASGTGVAQLSAIFIDRATGNQLEDADGNPSSTLDTGSNNPIRITLLDEDGNPFDSPQLITISTTQGAILPSSGTVLTNANTGIASVQIDVSGLDEGTAGAITVTYNNTEQGLNLTEQLNFEAGQTLAAAETVSRLTGVLYDQVGYQIDTPTTLDANGPVTTASALTQINEIQPATLELWFRQDGNPVPNTVINVSTTLGSLSPTSGNVLTNDLGIATLTLEVGDAESGEAGTITANAGDVSIDEPVTFSIGSSNLELGTGSGAGFTGGELDIANTNLSASGSTTISVNIVNTADSSSLYTSPIDIVFTSQCADAGLSEIDSPITSSNGTATATYTANGCEEDTIIATIAAIDGPSADGSISIQSSTPTSIAFVSSTPETIALEGTGGSGRLESAEVLFQVIDNTGAPEPGITVNFTLSTETGGVSLVEATALSDANGNVIARVNAGNIPTPVRVQATIDSTTISTVSDVLVISTGLPDQNSFTLSAATVNVGGGDTNGVQTEISIQAADAFNNPVPDGTAINFRTEFGSIQPSCTTSGGTCSVTWTSQSPRAHLTFAADDITTTDCNTVSNGTTRNIPCREDTGFATPNGAYSTIIAYALGEETFVDANGNGLFDSGETFDDIPEAFLDHNDDEEFGNANTTGSCSPACSETQGGDEETFIDFNSNSQYDAADSIYNGSLCSDAAEAANACTSNLLNVFDSGILVLSSGTAYFGLYDNAGNLLNGSTGNVFHNEDISVSGSASFSLDISDHFNGPLPSGTSVNVSSTNCDVDTTTDFEFGGGDTGFLTISIVVSEDDSTDNNFGVVTIEVNVPTDNNLGGQQNVFTFGCTDLD